MRQPLKLSSLYFARKRSSLLISIFVCLSYFAKIKNSLFAIFGLSQLDLVSSLACYLYDLHSNTRCAHARDIKWIWINISKPETYLCYSTETNAINKEWSKKNENVVVSYWLWLTLKSSQSRHTKWMSFLYIAMCVCVWNQSCSRQALQCALARISLLKYRKSKFHYVPIRITYTRPPQRITEQKKKICIQFRLRMNAENLNNIGIGNECLSTISRHCWMKM